ncbi:MAG: hypothetical protein KGS48_08860 [Bacteroidetes bacterium]|nr:hypothetical protein [Bacteroidota bacterium]
MSKKRFSEGLEELLQDSTQTAGNAADRKSAHKNFLSDIDSLLQEALDESLEKYEANQPDSLTASAKNRSGSDKNPPRQSLSGLDALIRQTIDLQEITSDEVSGKKRLTVAVDKTKLEKLKVIARLENAYLKDLLVNLIDGYIEDYVQQKGIDI